MNSKSHSLPNAEMIDLARESATELARLLKEKVDSDRASVKMDGHDMILPREAIELLRDILADMSQGNTVTVVPMHAEVTTQQAADFLNVSRPYLIKVLERGELPYCKVGSHRRIKFEDLVQYKQQMKENAGKALDELAGLAQKHDMGY